MNKDEYRYSNLNKNSNFQSTKNNNDPIKNENLKKIINDIRKNGPLSKTLTPEEINLPNKIGYTIGKYFANNGNSSDSRCLNTNQLGKYFQLISNVLLIDKLEEQKEQLFKVLPQIAYAAGRNVCPKDFYYLMETCISEKALETKKDIEALIDFLTAVVAYSKLNGR